MRIANNLPALTAFTSLNRTNKSLQKTINALSTGLRINSASDDAAGLAVSEKMRTQISGLDEALRNTQDGMSLLQTAEGALEQTSSMLQRMRELTLQASNGTLTSQDRQYIQLEVDELKTQIDRIAGTTQFNRKRILDGSSGALWSSSASGLRARINGGLTYTDEAGNRVSSEGNYRVEVKASPGEAQVQKSNILQQTIRLEEISVTSFEPDLSIFQTININTGTDATGAVSGNGWNFADNTLTITGDGFFRIEGTGEVTGNRITVSSGVNATVMLSNVNIDTFHVLPEDGCAFDMTGATVDMYLEGTNTLRSELTRAGIEVPEGSSLTISSAEGDGKTAGSLVAGGNSADWLYDTSFFSKGAGIGGAFLYELFMEDIDFYYANVHQPAGNITINGGTVTAGSAGGPGIGGAGDGGNITINGGNVTAFTEGGNSAGIGSSSSRYATGNGDTSNNICITITGGTIYAQTNWSGSAAIGGGYASDSGVIRIRDSMQEAITVEGYYPTMYPSSEIIGKGENGNISDVKYVDMPSFVPRQLPWLSSSSKAITTERLPPLSEIPSFYNASGVSLVSQPQTLTITQGDGQTATITLYDTDTMQDVADKINSVIADTFGHARHTDNPAKFCTISDGTQGTSESVYDSETVCDSEGNIAGYNLYATMLVRSGVPGKAGELFFSGDDDLLNALGLNTIREASETRYTASVYDAHSGKAITSDFRASGQEFKSIIPPEIDIELDAESGINSSWDENTKRYEFSGGTYTATLHLKDNGITFQTGANDGEDFTIQLGDMSSKALGLSSVNVATRETASRSMAIIDSAISRISSQRAKIGAYQNALEHTSESLTVTTANLTESESRIRDADMAGYIMDFVRLQILNQSGASMLSQANQLPQSVLSLLGN